MGKNVWIICVVVLIVLAVKYILEHLRRHSGRRDGVSGK